MKIIHCADLHLNSPLTSLPLDKAKTRREEIISTFERLCSYAKKNQVTAVIIAGDMFDSLKVTNKLLNRVLFAVSNCPTVDFLYLSGNHDSDFFLMQQTELPKNFKVFGTDWTYFDYGEVKIGGVCFNAYNTLSVYDNLDFPKDTINIAVMHGQIAGYKSKENAEIISLPRLVDKNIDYLALGHIHYYVEGSLDERGDFAYSGCLDARGFDETGDKGFILLETENGKLKNEFVNFSSRKFFEYEYDVTGKTSPYYVSEEIFNNVTAQIKPENVVKIILKGQAVPELDINFEALLKRLNLFFFYAKIKDKTTLKIDYQDYVYDKSIKGEFVRAVASSNCSEEEKSQIIMCGLRALKGEEL